MSHRYKMQYKVVPLPEGITVEQARAASKEGLGSCDAMLMASIIYPEDGSLSILFIGHDGRTNDELADIEWFKVWTMLTARLAKSETLPEDKRAFCNAVFELVREAMSPKIDA
jgi:hypothetical protein